MKKISQTLIVGCLLITAFACKKEVSPELEINVVDTLGQPVHQMNVKISVDGAEDGIINAHVIDSVRTDKFGKAYFKFDNTILIDVALWNNLKEVVDSVSILCETKRLKRKEDNIYERTLIFK